MKNSIKKPYKIIFKEEIVFILLFFFIAVASCSKTYDCDKTNLILSFNAKNIDSLSDFTIYKFQKGTNFSIFLDSIRIINGAGVEFEISNNKTNIYIVSVDQRLVSNYDWKIHFYSTTVSNGLNEIAISNIEEQNETMKCKKKDFSTYAEGCKCLNTLKSYKLNGVTGTIGNKVEYKGFIGYETTINP